ncbi:MAG: alpha/beta fold hydrolase [Dehalococcoidia bacterium]
MTELRPLTERLIPAADGCEIAVADWPGEVGPLVCVHGLTSHSRAFAGLAAELPGYRLVAVDCRGRGKSSKKPPFGLEQHAADLAAVMDHLGVDKATLVGHSMGAYIAGAFCARYPERVRRLVFVDGGYPQPLPPGATPDSLLESMLSFALEKLRRTWTSVEEYFAFYEDTPLYRHGVDPYGRAHFAYDLYGAEPNLRARIVEECIAPDWRDVLDLDAVARRLKGVKVPLLLVRAPGGLTGAGDEVVPDEVRDQITSAVAEAHVVDVPGTNHHTILFSIPGAHAVARAIEEFMR